MPLAAASARQSVGSPYSRWAIEASVSPSTTVRARCVAIEPDVGFCLPAACGISSIDTLQTARIGVPSAAKSVYLALTCVTKPGKLVIVPQRKTTSGGIAFFFSSDSSGRTQQASSFSTLSTTPALWSPLASRNISNESLHGSLPLNSGGPDVFDPRAALRSHFADFWIVTSFGLNWNASGPRGAPVVVECL